MKLSSFSLVLALTIWSTVTSKPTCSTNQTDNWRLPTDVFPIHYDIHLKTYLPGYGWKEDEKSETFEGRISIRVEVGEATDRIVLHSASLHTHSHEIISGDKNLQISRIELIPEFHFLVLHLNKIVQPQSGIYVLIEFSGKLGSDPHGFYLTKSPNPEEGKSERLNAVTKFETTYARFMIPCFDEPEFKATWQVRLTHPTGTTALSNTIDESSVPESDGWITTNYKKTVEMSSYLLAVFIGDVEFKETYTDSGVRIRVYAPPAYIDRVDHALNVSKLAVDYFEQRFNINYPMEKIDFVSAKNFAAGAMENWGLIVHIESQIFGNSSSVSDTVIHELAHQWFGNLVTMEFWNNVWLNEAFATYMEGGVRKHLDSNYDIDFERTKHDQSKGFEVANSYAIRDVNRNENKYQINYVVYSKGSSFLRMIEKLIGEESFDKAIRWYLFENQYGNTNEQDLYKAFELFMPSDLLGPDGKRLNIPEFAKCWTDQNGYPTIHVTVTNNNTIRLTQQMDQWLMEGHRNKGVCGYRWDVPIWYQHGAEEEVEFAWFGRNEHSIELAIQIPVIINLNSDGFYKVSYSNKLFSMQAAALTEVLETASDSTKYRLLADSFKFALDKENNWENVMRLSEALVNDTNEIIKKQALLHILVLEKQLQGEIKDYSKDLAKIGEIKADQPERKLIGDCNKTIKFADCYTDKTDEDLQLQCYAESNQFGYSIDRLLDYLKNGTESSPRWTILRLISCSKNDVLDRVLVDEQYHLSDLEKRYIREFLKKQVAPKSVSRRFMPMDNFLN